MSKRLCNIHGLWNKTTTQASCPQCKTISTKVYDKQYRNKDSKKIYDSHKWRVDIRPSALIRDGYKCVKCGYLSRGKGKDLDVDHIIELIDGGDAYNLDNLQALCKSCHNSKTIEEKIKRNNRMGVVKSLQPYGSPTEAPPKLSQKLNLGGTP